MTEREASPESFRMLLFSYSKLHRAIPGLLNSLLLVKKDAHNLKIDRGELERRWGMEGTRRETIESGQEKEGGMLEEEGGRGRKLQGRAGDSE
eukprot:757620-Hanusia_phi.AAC.3